MERNRIQQWFSNTETRFRVRLGAFFVLGVATSVLVFSFGPFAGGYLSAVYDSWRAPNAEQVSTSTRVLSFARPTRISIPAVGIEAHFGESLGVAEDRAIEVPDSYEKVGWYRHGPTPGELGPAVVLGHVDSFAGPAVFHPLTRISKGDRVIIDREDDSTAVFEVTALHYYNRDGFPAELVYGDIDHAGLRLVTCSGFFDRGSQQYSHNLVVYARLVEG